jgi:hypothetical protein
MLFRELRNVQFWAAKRQLAKRLDLDAPIAPQAQCPYESAVTIVRAAGLDPDEEALALRQLRNEWLMIRLEKLGFRIYT